MTIGFNLTNDAWRDCGATPAVLQNTGVADILYVVATAIPGGIDAVAHRLSPFGLTVANINLAGKRVYARSATEDRAFLVVSLDVESMVVDRTAPTVTSPATATIPENSDYSVTLTANEPVTFTKGDTEDASLFRLDGAVLTLPAKDFEVPVDGGGNNTYVCPLRAVDGFGNATDFTVTWTISDVFDAKKPSAPALTVKSGYKSNRIEWIDGDNGGSTITSHKLYRRVGTGASAFLGEITTASPYLDNDLTNDTDYFYTLTAVSLAGESLPSVERKGTPATPKVLTPEDFRLGDGSYPEWTRSGKLRWKPQTLVNPLEPGLPRDDSRPGTGIDPIAPLSSYIKVLDYRDDLLLIGGVNMTPGVRTSPMTISRGNNVRIMGIDQGKYQMACNTQQKSVWVEGNRGRFYEATDGTDASAFEGGSLTDFSEGAPDGYMVMCNYQGVWGWDRFSDGGTAIASITKTAAGADVVLVNVPASGRVAVGTTTNKRDVIIGSTFATTDNVKWETPVEPLLGFHDLWELDTTKPITDTTFSIRNPTFSKTDASSIHYVPVGTVAKGGKLYVMGGATGGVLGEHADLHQVGDKRRFGRMHYDRFGGTTSYQGTINGHQGSSVYFCRVNISHVMKRPDGSHLDPMQPNTNGIYIYTPTGFGDPIREFYETYIKTRFDRQVAKFGITPGVNDGGAVTTVGAKDACWFPNSYPTYRGAVINDVHEDFAPYDQLANGYVSPGYSEHVPGSGVITDILLDLDAASVPENIALGGSIGWFRGVHTVEAGIIDIAISGGADRSRVNILRKQLVRGRVALNFERKNTVEFEVTATVRGFPTNKFVKTFILPVADDGVAATVVDGSFLWDDVNTTNASAWTFTGKNLGLAAADRDIFLGVDLRSSGSSRTGSSVTVAGVTATRLGRQIQGLIGCLELWRVRLPDGVTGDIVVTATGSCLNCGVSAFRATGADTALNDLLTSTGGGGGTNPPAVSISTVADGYVMAFGMFGINSGGGYHTGTAGASVDDDALEIKFEINGTGADWKWDGVDRTDVYDRVVEASGSGPSILLAAALRGRG